MSYLSDTGNLTESLFSAGFRIVFLGLLLTWQHAGISQVGGQDVYEFLDLSASARTSGLGGHLLTVSDDDISLAYDNPAVLSDSMHGQFTFNHQFYFDGIDQGYIAFGHHISKWEITTHAGLKYAGYGDFILSDEFGNRLGSFKASEMALVIGASHKLNERFSVGVQTKWIQSRFESYHSAGMAADIGILYNMPEKLANLALVIRNAGVQFSTYAGQGESLPFDVQLGISKRLQYLPFRLSLVAHHLNRWNIIYDDPDQENNTIFLGDEAEESRIGIFADNLFRHLIISGEFLIGKNEIFRLRAAYNHLRRRELSVDNYISMAGFSLGAGLRLKRFTLDYAYSVQHLAGGTSHFGFSMNLERLFRKF